MFRSLFVRQMASYLVIILSALAILGVLLYSFFQNYLMETRTEELIREGKAISQYIEYYLSDLIDSRTLHYQYQVIDRFLGVTIWVTDARGNIWSSHNSSQLDSVEWENQKLTVDEFVQVLQGNTITRVGRFGESFPTPVLTVGMPLKINDKIGGTIFLHSPIKGINRTLRDTYISFWRSAIISSVLSIIISYFITRLITNPLIEINIVSREIARGNFKRRVKVKTKD